MGRSFSLLVLAAGLLLLVGCGDAKMKWNEEVELQSGEVVVVARTATFKENWVAGGGGGSLNKGMTLQLVQPPVASNPAPWSARFVPIVLDQDPDSHEWFIVATFYHCDSWYELGRPRLPYTEFRFRHGRWIQQSLSVKWIGRKANVLAADLSDRTEIDNSRPVLTMEHKRRILSDTTILPEFTKVVDKWSTGC